MLSNFLNEDDGGLDELINLNKVDGRVKVSSLKKINDMVAKNPDAAVNVIPQLALSERQLSGRN